LANRLDNLRHNRASLQRGQGLQSRSGSIPLQKALKTSALPGTRFGLLIYGIMK
jgi:hypothetical protein